MRYLRISRFERNTKSGDPFGVLEMMEISGSEYRHEGRFRFSAGIVIIGRAKGLM